MARNGGTTLNVVGVKDDNPNELFTFNITFDRESSHAAHENMKQTQKKTCTTVLSVMTFMTFLFKHELTLTTTQVWRHVRT